MPASAAMNDRICPQCGKATALATCPEHHCPTIVMTPTAIETVKTGVVIGGRYQVDRLLGRGGFGAVYLCRHVATGQQMVVKVLKPDLSDDPTQVQRFFNEARTSSQLSHPNTVRVFDFGQTDAGLLYIAMELLEGKELQLVLRESGGVLDPLRTARIAVDVLKSLAEAHGKGLVHRDLKPDNIFLCTAHGEEDFVKVIDFGIAKTMDPKANQDLTKTGFTVGTPKYMSPEQVLNKALDGRSDLYALGVILYQCLSGEVPHAGASPMETLMLHLQSPARPLATVAPQPLPPGLAAIVMKVLQKDPGERFDDAEDMRAALEEILVTAGHLSGSGQRRAMSARMRAVATPERAPTVPCGVPVARQESLGVPHPGPDRAEAKPSGRMPAAPALVAAPAPYANHQAALEPAPAPVASGPRGVSNTTRWGAVKGTVGAAADPDGVDATLAIANDFGAARAQAAAAATLQAGTPAGSSAPTMAMLLPFGPPDGAPQRRGARAAMLAVAAVAVAGVAGAALWLAAAPAPAAPAVPVLAAVAPAVPASTAALPAKAAVAAADRAPAPLPAATPLAPADLIRVAALARSPVLGCLATCPGVEASADLAVAVEVDPTGQIVAVTLPGGNRDAACTACITAVVRLQTFPAAPGGTRVGAFVVAAPQNSAVPQAAAARPAAPVRAASPRRARPTAAADGDEAL